MGIFYSFEYSNFSRTANLTRLLACSKPELEKYARSRLDIGPTFVHRNMRDDPLVDEKDYPSYNKPFSVLSWLAAERPLRAPDGSRVPAATDPAVAAAAEEIAAARSAPDVSPDEEEYVLFTDADMLFRDPIDPVALGAARGVVVSAEYTYLVGTTSGFAERFIAKELVPKLAQVGGFHIFHREVCCAAPAARPRCVAAHGRRDLHFGPCVVAGPARDRAAVAHVHEGGARLCVRARGGVLRRVDGPAQRRALADRRAAQAVALALGDARVARLEHAPRWLPPPPPPLPALRGG